MFLCLKKVVWSRESNNTELRASRAGFGAGGYLFRVLRGDLEVLSKSRF